MKKIFITILFSVFCNFIFAQNNTIAKPTKAVDDQIYEQTDVPAQYKKGQDAMYKDFLSTADYPRVARRNKEGGTVKIRFVVTKEGKAQEVKLFSSSNGNQVLGNEATKIISDFVKRNINEWTPATVKNKPVSSYFDVEIVFSPEKKRP
jgi:TonB family protein